MAEVDHYEFEPPADRSLTSVLQRQLRERPDQTALADVATSYTYREVAESARRLASGFAAAGVADGDPVLLMLDNHSDFALVWVALSYCGGLEVPVNTAYRGTILIHVASDSRAKAAVIEAAYLDRFREVADRLPSLEVIYVRGDVELASDQRWREAPFTELIGDEPIAEVARHAWDPMGILYTSGTTGNSKGVLVPHGLAYSYCSMPWIDEGERIMVNLPMFHIGGQWAGVYASWLCGGSAVIIERFSVTTFWDDARKYACQQTVMLGAMASFLFAQPARPDDRDQPIRKVAMVPVIAGHKEFAERFDVRIGSAYGLTEFSSPIVTPYGSGTAGLAGWLRDDFEARVVDDDDMDVPLGTTGELVLRPRTPWAMFSGYHDLPQATAEGWRNLWFHTGDAMRLDEAGRFYFVDRKKDSLRRRGENVSSFEVEAEVLRFNGIVACAAVAVASEHSEDEIKIVVVPRPGVELDFPELLRFLCGRLPYFMVPRYYEAVSELPLTPTQKIKKAELRAAGVTPATWDHSEAGFKVTRHGLVEPSGQASA